MTAAELLRHLRHAGVEVWAEGGRLHYDGPEAALTGDLLARLRTHKPEIIELVQGSGRRRALAPAQATFWLLDSLHHGEPRANEQFAIALDGALDRAALARAWQDLFEHHDVLRARFGEEGGEPWQVFDASPPLLQFWGEITDAGLQARAAADAATAFDLRAGGLLRAGLARLGPESHVLVVTAHHIVADGLVVPLIRDELARGYEAARAGRIVRADEVPQYAEFVHGRRAAAAGAAAALRWWQDRLAGAPREHGLPGTGRPAASGGAMQRGDFTIDPGLAARLRALARDEGATLFALLLAALRVLLVRHGADEDLLIATPVTWRDEPRRRRTIGCLIDTVVLRTPLAGNPAFTTLLRQERDGLLAALAHRAAAPGDIVAALGARGPAAGRPLAQILVQFDAAAPPQVAAGVAFRLVPAMATCASYQDLEWSLTDHGAAAGLTGHLAFARERFDASLFAALPRRLLMLLTAIARDPAMPVGELPLLDEAERHQLLVTWNDTAGAYPDTATLHGLVAARWRATPQAVALRTAAGYVTAGALEQRVAALEGELQVRGAGPGTRVAVSLEPAVDLVVALLAVLRTGAAYVPLDPAYPPARRAFMLADADACLLISTDAGVDASLMPAIPRLAPDRFTGDRTPQAMRLVADDPDSPACILYTSGSTGEPKGAITLHRGAVNRCHALWQSGGYGTRDVFCLRTSINFVDSLWEIFGALIHGIPLAVLPAGSARDPALLVPALAGFGVTQLVLVPPLLRALLESGPALGRRLPQLATVITSGEPLPADLLAQARAALPGVRLVNTYGTSEVWDATACDTGTPVPLPGRSPIGRPIANVRCYVLDARLQPVPPGVAGELCVAGVGVGGGYWRRPELTAERFVADPFVSTPGARLNRTGDLARHRPDGSLECLGRLDRQLKLHGHRIEPGEIEAVLRACPEVTDAVVGLDGVGPAARLVAYVATAAADLRPRLEAAVRARLPAPLRPSAWVLLERLPLTPSGKVDRAALPPATGAGAAAGRAPEGAREQAVAALWSEVLGVPVMDATAGFFALGGQSLLALRLLARAAARFGTALTLRDFFDDPTVAGMAARLGSAGAALVTLLGRADRHEPLPLSFGQERLWLLDQLDPASAAYHIAWTVTIEGVPDRSRLQAALAALVDRHEALRTRFPAVDGQPQQQVQAALVVPLAVESVAAAERAARRVALARQPFDLAQGPLLRATLLSDESDSHELVLVLHHAITDGTSNAILFRELAALYRGEALAPLPAQYADFAAWQRRVLDPAALAPELDWWQARLAGAPPLTTLPLDFPRPPVQRFAGAWVWRALEAAPAARLAALARERDCTLYMLLLAAFAALLQRHGAQDDLPVGTPVSARPHAELEEVVGLFVNTVVLRLDVGGDPDFGTLLARVRAVATEAFAHEALPFERLVARLRPERTLAHAPVFQVMFNLVPIPQRTLAVEGGRWQLGRLVDHGAASFDLTLTVGEHADGLELVFEYDTALFLPDTVVQLADAYTTLLQAWPEMLDTPLSALPLGTVVEPPAVAVTAPATGDILTVRFAAQVAATPAATALVAGETRLDYAALDRRSRAIAQSLRDRGAGPGAHVAVCLPRGVDLVAAMLGTMQAGAAVVPLDPAQPAARLAALLADAGAAVVIGACRTWQEETTGGPDVPAPLVLDPAELPPDAALLAEPVAPAPDDVAYLVYTSGSTGAPKGVVVTHGNLAATWRGWVEAYALEARDVHLQMAPAGFDVFIGDLVRSLASGGCLVLCPRETLLEPAALYALLRREAVTVAEFVPATMRLLLDWLEREEHNLAFMRLVIVGSDTWHPHEYRALRARVGPRTRVINSYGVAEATIDSAWFEGEPPAAGVLPIGRAFPQAVLGVRDSALRPVPRGVPGELVIAGAGVARGYWRREALTTARFVSDPLDPARRLYRSGDRARQRADGGFDLLGRLDEQMKLRGLRVEAGEIEGVLGAHPAVRAAAVGLRAPPSGEPRLVGWVVTTAPAPPVAALLDWLRQRLPDYMVPASIVPLAALPLTPSGKLDRRALPAPDWSAAAGVVTAPRTAVEAALAELWGEVLGLGRAAGRDEDFFALGGHSLLAAQLVARIRDALAVELPLRTLFDAPTVAGVAVALATGSAPATAAIVAAPASTGPRRGPLAASQQRLWFLERLDPGRATWHLPLAWQLRGVLDADRLRRALQAVVDRQEALRMRFADTADGAAFRIEPVQVVIDEVDLHDDGDLPASLSAELARPFDLRRGPLLRATLLRRTPDRHVLLLVVHHLVADGWSLAVLARELGAAWRASGEGRAPTWTPLPVQYADYARWQREALAGPAFAAQLDWWCRQLAGAKPLISLPLDRPRPAVQRHHGAWHQCRLPAALTTALHDLARRERATPFMVLLAGFVTLLARYGGDEDLVIGTPVAGRGRTELEGLVGFFVNTLALRVDAGGDPPFRELVARVRRTALDAFAHADVPFEKLVEVLAPPRSRAWTPIAQVFFVWHNEPRATLVLDGLEVETIVPDSAQAKFDLSLHVAEHDGELVVAFNYDTDLFDEPTVLAMSSSYVQLLAEVARDGGVRLGEVQLLDAR
ncbi:MAG: amino acid adenylation domain-containing protein, partial [Gammaproteobacteria bacterium]|nr:amino acid adenylation domain-containing protein [Gammaproteobacteria bacterium]